MSPPKAPKRFVGLHGHTTSSQGDAIGLASDHIDSALGNGLDGHAITDHGNMNALANQWFHTKNLQKKGVNFTSVYGVEAYFVESLAEWKRLHSEDKVRKAAEALAKKVSKTKTQKAQTLIGDPAAPTQLDLLDLTNPDEGHSESPGVTSPDQPAEEESGLVENENETKAGRWKNPLTKRSHLVLLAKNSQGLKDLFALVSESFVNGFYRYPRVDFDLLRRYCKGNIIGLQACVGGYLAGKVFDFQEAADFNLWGPTQDRFEEVQAVLRTELDRFVEVFGPENYYLELQMNKLAPQWLVNQHFMELSRRSGTKLVVTVDSHYSRPEHWREREIYKLMARQQVFKQEVSQDDLPKTIDELKCELYPKNADQVWESYLRYSEPYPDLRDDDLVREAIERTWDIAHHQIDPKVSLDTSVKLPRLERCVPQTLVEEITRNLPEEDRDKDSIKSFKVLVKLAIEGLVKFRKLGDKPEYVARLKHELEVIKHLGISNYFLTYAKIQEILSQEMLLGAGRGSAAGSLLCYVLNLTQVDPIKYGLLFARFLVRNKQGYPDIDCLLSNSLVCLPDNKIVQIQDLKSDDLVLDHKGELQRVLFVQSRPLQKKDHPRTVFVNVNGQFGALVATGKHRLVTPDGEQVRVSDVKPGQTLSCQEGLAVVVGVVPYHGLLTTVTDITVTGSSTFRVIPFSVGIMKSTPTNRFLVCVHTYTLDADDLSSMSADYWSKLTVF